MLSLEPRSSRLSLFAQTLDRIFRVRDALIGAPRFQRTVAALPLVRRIAHGEARAVFDLCAGFVYSQVVLASVELGLLTYLRQQPRSLPEIARETGLSEAATETLVRAAISLGLLSRRSGARVGLGMRGAAIASNRALIELITHHRMVYRDLADPVALLKGKGQTELAQFWGYAQGHTTELDAQRVRAYSDLMSASQSLVADEILHAYPFKRHRTLLDIGGGDGTFIQRAAAHYPHLTFQHFDLPPVSARAAVRFEACKISDRTQLYAGSFYEDALPSGADVATLVRIVHDHDDDACRRLFCAARDALGSGRHLVIAEPMADTAGAEAVGDAYFAFYLMAMGSGRARSFTEIAALLSECGFKKLREVQTRIPLQVRIIVAQT